MRRAHLSSCVALAAALAVAGPALADGDGDGPTINPFRCPGEADSLARDLSIAQIRDEIEKRVDAPGADDRPATVTAHELCVIAELKRRVGDRDAGAYYERAIEANPDEPGYEVWYGYYLRNVRGADGPHIERAERRYYSALAKLDRRRAEGVEHEFDRSTEDRAQKGLLSLYQTDGQPILRWRSYRFTPRGRLAPGVALSTIFSVSSDTQDFHRSSAARNFTSEAAFAESRMRLGRSLTDRERWDLIRAPLRYEVRNRLRLRHTYVGAVDLTHHHFRAHGAQIAEFTSPNDYVDVTVSELGVGYGRVLDLYPLFDLNVAGAVRRTTRTGVVEYQPDQQESFNTYELSPTVSRFLGPDKLSVTFTYVLMAIADLTTGVDEERARGQSIRAVGFDYAMYRPVLLPQLHRGSLRRARHYTRGWHFFGGYAQDDQLYGQRQVTRRDLYGGSSLRGLGHYDVTLQGTLASSSTYYIDPLRPEMGILEDGTQANAQVRSTAVLSRRLIDEDVTPGVPRAWAGFAPASLVLVMPVSHDLAIRGSSDYENVRAGAELWLKLIGTGFGGTTFLVTAGYDYQYFYRLVRSMHMAHLDLRVGW